MNVNEIVRQISTDFQNPWFIFNASELTPKTIIPIERWGWISIGERIERNVITDGHPRYHRREILLSNGRWRADGKVEWGSSLDRYTTDIIQLPPRRVENTYTLSPHLQNLITQAILQPHNPDNLEELKTKIQNIHFVRGVGYNPSKPWLVFNKQWLYEQITNPNPDEDFFIIQGLPHGAKSNTELKQFLQQEDYLPAEQTSNQTPENHSQNNNNSTYSNSGSTAYPSSTGSSNNYNSTFANSDSENYPSDSYVPSSSYSSSPSSLTTSEDKSDSHSNSPSPADNSSSSSPGGSGYAGSFSNVGEASGKNSSATITSNKPKNPESSQPTFEPKEPAFLSPKPSSSNNLTNQDELTKQKQQIIQEIKEKLDQIPNLDLPNEIANWKQEIEQMQNLETIKAYQKNLLEKTEKDKQLKQETGGYSLETRSKEKNIIPWVAIGSVLVGGVVFMAFYLRAKKRNQ